MRIIGVADVEAANGRLVMTSDDLLTPLARDRARELGVVLECSTPAGPTATPGVDPPSGALYRRGGRVVTSAFRIPSTLSSTSHTNGAATQRHGRVSVIGAGHVGVMTAMRLAEADIFSEIVMSDIVPGLAAGLALDLWHTASLRRFGTPLRSAAEPREADGCDFAVITAGQPRKPGMSRADLTAANAAVVTAVAEGIAEHSPDAIVVVVTNPLDEMTHLAQAMTGFPPERVLGMAGVLDAARFCAWVASATGERPDAVSAVALGSHGDEMVIPLSQARVASEPIERRLDPAMLRAIIERTRDSGAEIVRLLQRGSAYHAPAAAVARMVLAMANNTGEVLPVCARADGAYGLTGVYLGLPARLGGGGVEEIVELDLTDEERAELHQAAERIAERVSQLVS
jgi:malate dehydrogenase